jgi:phenylalanyl-tRNA synthetase beta chain
VPFARVDVTGEEDLIEEIARVRGYDNIPLALPGGLSALEPERPEAAAERRVRTALAGLGFDEVVNYSFVARSELAAFGAAERSVALSNAISPELSVMRTTLLPSLLKNVIHSQRHQAQGVKFYEWARSYHPDPQGGVGLRPVARESLEVAGVLWGLRDGQRAWTAKEAGSDFYDAKGAVEAVLSALHIEGARFEPAVDGAWYHPRACATVRVGELVLGTLGELHPQVQRALDAPAGVFLFQLEVGALVRAAKLVPKAQALSKFPSVLRDLAVVVPLELANAALQQLILEVGAPLVAEAQVFDVYTGKPIPEGQKNVAYALRYAASDRTLTDAEVNLAHQKIVAEVNARLGGTLRG